MATRTTFTAFVFAGLCYNLASAQQFGGTGGTGGGAPASGGFSVNSFTTPSTSTGSNSSGMSSSSNTGGSGAGGNAAFGTSVISRPGFLAPSDKLGFLTPSNTNAISTATGRTGTTGGITGINSRLGGLSGMNGLGGLGGSGSQMGRTNNSATSGTTQLRIPMRVVSSQPVSAPAQIAVATRFTQRVTKLPGLQTLDVTMTAVEGRTAVLRGKVVSKEQAELIGRLALLEPGISSVRNELTVDSGLVSSETLPARQ